jgi:site-specific DNA-adenine methylase
MKTLRPFWRYYGGKYRAAPKYPAPVYDHIVEPFAGAAGYALRYHTRRVTLVDAYPVVADIWRYLIAATPAEILRVPLVECVDDLPAWVPQEARWLVGFWLCTATTAPRRTLTAGMKRTQQRGNTMSGWVERSRERVASQVDAIKHWRIIEGDYRAAGDAAATWFIDPPYNNKAGSYYHGAKRIDYGALGDWCMSRAGHVIVCENTGADWLPFRHFADTKAMTLQRGDGRKSAEVIYHTLHGVPLYCYTALR